MAEEGKVNEQNFIETLIFEQNGKIIGNQTKIEDLCEPEYQKWMFIKWKESNKFTEADQVLVSMPVFSDKPEMFDGLLEFKLF